MAVIDRARYKPDTYRSSLETLVAELNPQATPPTGTVTLAVQIVSYSDTDIPAISSYVPGDPGTERYITVIHEGTITYAIEGLAGLTAAQVQSRLEQDLDAWALSVKPAIALLRRIVRAAKRTPTRAIP